MNEPITNVEDAVRELGALPMPAGSEPQLTPKRLSEIRDLIRYESSIAFYSHRAKESILLLVAEAEEAARLRARVAELEATTHVAPSPSCTRCYGADAVRFVANGGATAPCRACGPSQVEQLQARMAEQDAQREALAERLRAGQRWQRGRRPELVSENLVSQSELRDIFGIPLVAPWADDYPAETGGAS
ncbi:hypothetical protein [Streptomyces chartreusis]|uniref:hypothetical protein n=1 Tax=Streptomyces chartreusis TaxID=1969 RepID=UPI00363B2CF1